MNKNYFFQAAVLLNRFSQYLIQIYGQRAHFWWFVRKQNAFYGQTGIFRWFVRKFLHIMMRIYGHKPLFGAFVRKTGSKRLNFYGQTAVFAHFVRNRLFWSRTFTDRRPIFIDVSVILPNAAPDKSARQTISITEGDYHACAKIGSNLQSVANHPFFQFATEFFPAAFWSNCFLEMSEYQFIWMLLDKHNKNDSHH